MKETKAEYLPINLLQPFEDHPFKVTDDEEMDQLVWSILTQGLLTPLVVRPLPTGKYEVISGHRRLHACKKAGIDSVPALIANMDRDAAAIALVDSNLHREHILPSEKAFAYKLKMDALSHQGTSCQVGTKSRSDESIGEITGESARQVQRYIRLTNLIPEILQMVDDGRIALTPAVELSYLNEWEQKDLLAVTVKNSQGAEIPLSYVLKERRVRDLKNIVQGRDGDYYPLNINVPDNLIPAVEKAIKETILATDEFAVEFAGGYYTSRGMIGELAIILIISLLLLYFILAAQFESLVQPFIILSEIVADLTGALFLLWICGAGINLMSMIGIVVMCGIIINDSILKVDTINRLRKQYSLLRAIMVAGNRRLSPILMTSLTTILAIAPFLVRGNMGADLQFPLSLALIGGMVVGTAVSIFFIPVLYYNIYNRRSGRNAAEDSNKPEPVGKKN